MKTNRISIIIGVFAFLLSASTLFAQAPRTMSYQGFVTDGAQQPLTGSHTIEVKLYNVANGGSALHSETFLGTVSNGIFNVIIGSNTVLPQSVAFDKQYWLGVSIDGGSEMTPRTALTSAPYAMMAKMAESVDPDAAVTSLNTLKGDVTIEGTGGTTVTKNGNTISINSAGGGAGVSTINNQNGAITLQGGGGTTVSNVGGVFTISSSGGGGTGIQGVQSSDGSLSVSNANGPTATLNIANGGVKTATIADGAVTTAKYADNSISNAKIQANAVGYVQILGGAVGTASIADNAVTSAKILDGTIANADIADATITAAKMSGTGITTGYLLTKTAGGVDWAAAAGGGSLTLPYSATVSNANTLFDITQSGSSAKAASFKTTNGSNTERALYAESQGTGPAAEFYKNVASNNWTMGAFAGANASGSAFFARTDGTGGAAVMRNYNASNSTDAVVGSTFGTGRAGYFQINNSSSSNIALEGTSNGTGAGLRGSNSTISGLMTGVLGEVASTSGGSSSNGVTGVLGKVTSTAPGGYSAGVRGINNSTTGNGIGVVGYHAGSGYGVYGEAPTGIGVLGTTTATSGVTFGVAAQVSSPSGAALIAKYSGSGAGIALQLDNGALKVSGTNKTVFQHTATAANSTSNWTTIDNPLTNGDPTAMLIITPVLMAPNNQYNNFPVGVWYNSGSSKWAIFNQNSAAIPANSVYNVLVVKQ